jgi:cytidylate kinase
MRIVTISRLLGAYGDIIAPIVARRMGLSLIGRDQLHELAQGCDPEFTDICSIYETEHGPHFFERIFFDRPSYTSVFEALTFEQASRGNVVIVGRGAQIILREIPGVARVRIVAPKDVRVKRIMERLNFSRDEAEDYAHKYDHERENLVRSIFQSDPQDWSLYDVIINTERFSAGDAAQFVIDAVEKIEKVPDEEALKESLRNRALAKRIEALIRKVLTSAVARYVMVKVEPGGLVKLSGRIREKTNKEKAEELASQFPGVTKVESDLKVMELSFGY